MASGATIKPPGLPPQPAVEWVRLLT